MWEAAELPMGRGGASKVIFRSRSAFPNLCEMYGENSVNIDFCRPYVPQGSPIELRSIEVSEISGVGDIVVSASASRALGRCWVWVIRPPVRHGPLCFGRK